MPAIAESAAVAESMLLRQRGDVVHGACGQAPAALIEVASLAAIVQRAAHMAPARVAMDLPRVISLRDYIADETFDLRRKAGSHGDVDPGSCCDVD